MYCILEGIFFRFKRKRATIRTGFKTHPLLAHCLSLALPITLHDTTYFHL